MKEFTIDDAIDMCNKEAGKYKKIYACHANKASDMFNIQQSDNWEQIVEWLTELKERRESNWNESGGAFIE